MTGKAIIFTAPSGSGKTSIIKPLLERNPSLTFSISATTRPPREGEVYGKDYYFFSLEEFKGKIEAGEFIEWEEVYPEKLYGTLKTEIERIWAGGKTVIFDVEVKGASNLKSYFGNSAKAIFIKVPSIEILEKRLTERSTESQETLSERLERAEFEMSFESQFDETVVNEVLEEAIEEADQIVKTFISKS